MSPQVLCSVVRIAPHPRIYVSPSRLEDTLAFARVLLEQPDCTVVRPGTRHFAIFEDLSRKAVASGNLVQDAWFRSSDVERHLANIEKRVVPSLTVVPYDLAAARAYGEVRAELDQAGRLLADADLQIAATALVHDLELVTGNVRHFSRVPGLRICDRLAGTRDHPPA